jgi:hypothetical protein
VTRWSGKFQWRRRADANDRWLSEKDQEAAEVFAKMDAEKWALRERAKRERKFEQGDRLTEAADLMPFFSSTGQSQTEWDADMLLPAWRACRDLGLAKAAAEIARALRARGDDISITHQTVYGAA